MVEKNLSFLGPHMYINPEVEIICLAMARISLGGAPRQATPLRRGTNFWYDDFQKQKM